MRFGPEWTIQILFFIVHPERFVPCELRPQVGDAWNTRFVC